MKKKLITIISVVLLSFLAGYNVYSSRKNAKISDLILVNVEALAQNGEVTTENTGPGKVEKCAGKAGHRKFCMAENTNSCSESPCG